MSDTRKAVIAASHAPQFPDGIGRVPNNPAVAAAFSALFKGEPAAQSQSNGWIEEKSRVICRHHGRLGGVLEMYSRGEERTGFRLPSNFELNPTQSPYPTKTGFSPPASCTRRCRSS